jgi:hypothetical protein
VQRIFNQSSRAVFTDCFNQQRANDWLRAGFYGLVGDTRRYAVRAGLQINLSAALLQEGVPTRKLHQIGIRSVVQGLSQQDQASILLDFFQNISTSEEKILRGGHHSLLVDKILQRVRLGVRGYPES